MRVDFGSLPKPIKQELVDGLQFRINEVSYRFDDDTTDRKWKGDVFVSTTRMNVQNLVFTTTTNPGGSNDYDVWRPFPFDKPSLFLGFELTSCTLASPGCFMKWKVRYNVHDYLGTAEENAYPEYADLMRSRALMSFKPAADSMPNFNILHSTIRHSLPREKKTDKKTGVTMVYFPKIEYVIPLFRHPGPGVRTMVFPLLVVNTGTLLVTFMNDFGAPSRVDPRASLSSTSSREALL